MSAPLRKKRNFKSLALDVTVPETPAEPSPPPPKESAPTGGTVNGTGKRRPPPLKPSTKPSVGGSMAESHAGDQAGPSTGNGLGSSTAQSAVVKNMNRLTMRTQLSTTLTALNKDGERQEFRNEDLVDLQELGQGNGGSVKKVRHIPTDKVIAKKVVLIDAKPSVRKQILRELQIMHDCHSEYIVEFHSAFLADPNICICMEYMDRGSFDGIYKKIGGIEINVVAMVAIAVLEGLVYLYDVHRIIHRDIKPSNILCNSKGQIKICDFGVSGELINSIADTFVGTSTYMSPERIQGAQYTVKSDVWSLGISLIELVLGRFPFSETEHDDSDFSDLEGTLSPGNPLPSARQTEMKAEKKDRKGGGGVSLQGGGMTMSILELLQHIVNEPAPELSADEYSVEAHSFVAGCLLKDPLLRKTPQELLAHEWIEIARGSDIDLEKWANSF